MEVKKEKYLNLERKWPVHGFRSESLPSLDHDGCRKYRKVNGGHGSSLIFSTVLPKEHLLRSFSYSIRIYQSIS